VIWTIVNLEVWDISRADGNGRYSPAPTGISAAAGCTETGSWHEYGHAALVCGAFFDLYKRLGIAPHAVHQWRGFVRIIPRVAQQAKDAGWGVHGPCLLSRDRFTRRPDQKAMIDRAMSVIENFTGKRPGRFGSDPGLTQTAGRPPNTSAEAGVKYIGDWVYDDEPDRDPHRQGTARDACPIRWS